MELQLVNPSTQCIPWQSVKFPETAVVTRLTIGLRGCASLIETKVHGRTYAGTPDTEPTTIAMDLVPLTQCVWIR
jgi:hypothetical protein